MDSKKNLSATQYSDKLEVDVKKFTDYVKALGWISGNPSEITEKGFKAGLVYRVYKERRYIAYPDDCISFVEINRWS